MTATDATCVEVVPAGSSNYRLMMAKAAFLAGYKPTTRASYDDGLKQWFHWCAQCGLDPLEVQRPHIDLWGRYLEEERKLNPSTVAHRLVTLRSFYEWCEDEGYVKHSPARKVRLPKVSADSSTHGMTRSEVSRLVAAAERNPTQHALVCLLALNGLRISEACSANIEDLSFEQGHRTLRIVRKGGKRQTLPLSPKTVRVIEKAIDGRSSGPILLTEYKTRMTRHNAGKIIARLGVRAGLPFRTHPHQLPCFCDLGARRRRPPPGCAGLGRPLDPGDHPAVQPEPALARPERHPHPLSVHHHQLTQPVTPCRYRHMCFSGRAGLTVHDLWIVDCGLTLR